MVDIRFATGAGVNLETRGWVSKRHFLRRGQGWKRCGDGTNLDTRHGARNKQNSAGRQEEVDVSLNDAGDGVPGEI
jgi:hypothetical protein